MYVKEDFSITGTTTSERIALRAEIENFNVSIMVSIPALTTGNITLQYTGKLDFENSSNKDFKIHTDMNNIDLSAFQNQMIFVNLLSPCSAIQFKTNAVSDILSINIIQSGNVSGQPTP